MTSKMLDNFLLDEVRCGFVIPAAIKQAWAAELEVLAELTGYADCMESPISQTGVLCWEPYATGDLYHGTTIWIL